jgi:hypothetical protein
MRPMLSPALVALNRDAFVASESPETTAPRSVPLLV